MDYKKIEKEYKQEKEQKLKEKIKQEIKNLDEQEELLKQKRSQLANNPETYFIENSTTPQYIINGKIVDEETYNKEYKKIKQVYEDFQKEFDDNWKKFWAINHPLRLLI